MCARTHVFFRTFVFVGWPLGDTVFASKGLKVSKGSKGYHETASYHGGGVKQRLVGRHQAGKPRQCR